MPGPMTGHCRIWRKSRTGNRLMMRDVPRGRRGLSLALGGDRQGLFLGKVIDDRVERGIAYRGQGRVITPRGKRRRCLEGEGSFQCHDAATARRGALLIDQGEAVALVERQCRAVGEDSQAQRARAGLSARGELGGAVFHQRLAVLLLRCQLDQPVQAGGADATALPMWHCTYQFLASALVT